MMTVSPRHSEAFCTALVVMIGSDASSTTLDHDNLDMVGGLEEICEKP